MDYRDNSHVEALLWDTFQTENPYTKTVMIVCPVCEGEGAYVDPDVDRNGLTASDFDYYGDDFAESYFGGHYDVKCGRCKGDNVVPYPVDEDRAAIWEAMRESLWRDLAYEAAERRMGC
jgi:hypothetical protein